MKLTMEILLLFLTYLGISSVTGIAVMSVDLGSEWMKVGYVSPGVPMEIALNKESKRKSPAIISFRDNVRLFGEDASTIGLRFPKQAYSYLLDLLGKSIDHPLVKLYQSRFPYYEIVADPDRGTVLFKQDDGVFYSPEELIAQMLTKAREFAEAGAQQPIKECVLTVPGFFNQVERKALLQAAHLAGLKVLQLINDYTAVALNYGIFRSKTFNDTAQYMMFYDMGASSTTATLVAYQTVKTKERGFVETNPQLSILGVGFDRTLGGLEMQLRLRDFLAKKFNEMKKTKTDVFTNPRAYAKLFKEAGRLKNILSANAEHYAQIEGLLDEQDFKLLVKREEFEELIKDLLDRVPKPVEQALKAAHLTMDVVERVVLVGAGTRVPKLQEFLQNAVGQELAKNLNTDEAAAMGAVYKAADLSTGFKVAKFITKDAVLYPIQITFQRQTDEGTRFVKRTLFGLMNPYPQKKLITFNKHTDDFDFVVSYGELEHLPESEVLYLGAKNLTEYHLSGVAEALNKNKGDNLESKGIKAHFALDESGILQLFNVELLVEKTVVPSQEEEGTLSKLGSTFSKLFGGNEDEKPAAEEKTVPSDEKPVTEETEETSSKAPETAETEKTENATQQNQTAHDSRNGTKDAKGDTKPKVITIKEPIQTSEKSLALDVMSEALFEKSLEKIKTLDKLEREINRRASALNNLESFVIDVQNKLDEDEFAQSGTKEEIEKIRAAGSEVSEWLYDEGSDADAVTYEKKLDELHQLTKPLFSRVWEHKERPEALKALHSMLNHSSTFLMTAKNMTSSSNPEKDIFTDAEVEALDKLITDTTEWRDKMVQEQNALKKHETVKLTVKLLTDKMASIDREVKYLINKIRMFRPKKVEKPVETNTSESNSTTTEEEKEKPSEDNQETLETPEVKPDEAPLENKEEEKPQKEKTKESKKTKKTQPKKKSKDGSINPSKPDDNAEDSHTEL